LYKALREAILNSIDAGATSVTVDLSSVERSRVVEITDDGSGMSLAELQESFMSLGGSVKFATTNMFGRIGIGSLALMHYAEAVHIETKEAGSKLATKAIISHPWSLDQEQRTIDLSDLFAGEAWQEPSERSKPDHYTTIRLIGVDDVLLRECGDVRSYYRLVEQLRRVLPLAWPSTSLHDQLRKASPDLVGVLQEHTTSCCARVTVQSKWSNDDVLTKRVFGDGGIQEEEWEGPPKPILTSALIATESGSRRVQVAGYLLSQVRPSVEWAGLTARVQNVAVEEHTFFDLESDPGFRKYITGEVWFLGELDRSRLVNIDRASFSRESADYRGIARVMQAEITQFKTEFVQAPRRSKVAIKRRLDQQRALVETSARLGRAAAELVEGPLPSSNNGRIRAKRSRSLLDDLDKLGAVAAVRPGGEANNHPYRLRVAEDGKRVIADVDRSLADPIIEIGRSRYRLVLIEGGATHPPILIKNRPRQITFNLAHGAFDFDLRQPAVEAVLSLELAYLLGAASDEELYDRVLRLISHT